MNFGFEKQKTRFYLVLKYLIVKKIIIFEKKKKK